MLGDGFYILFFPLDMLFGTDKSYNGLGIIQGAVHVHFVTQRDSCVAVRYAYMTVVQQTAADKVASDECADLQDALACQRGVVGADGHAVRNCVRICRFFVLDFFLCIFQ